MAVGQKWVPKMEPVTPGVLILTHTFSIFPLGPPLTEVDPPAGRCEPGRRLLGPPRALDEGRKPGAGPRAASREPVGALFFLAWSGKM